MNSAGISGAEQPIKLREKHCPLAEYIYIYMLNEYRKPPTISPGLIFFRKRFLMGLYKGGLIYGGGGLYMDDLLC